MHPIQSRTRSWGRAVAIVATPIGILLVAIRLRAMGPAVTSGFDQGRALGQLIGGPIVLGMLVWGAIVIWRRGREPNLHFFAPGLVATVALIAIVTALASPRI